MGKEMSNRKLKDIDILENIKMILLKEKAFAILIMEIFIKVNGKII